MSTLKRYAEAEGKTVVITLHQPSSQIFHLCDKLLLLCGGRTAYFGDTNKVVDFFGGIGLNIMPHYNPADFICKLNNIVLLLLINNTHLTVEQVKGSPELREKIISAAKEARKRKDYPQELQMNQDCIYMSDKYNNEHGSRGLPQTHGPYPNLDRKF